MITLLIILALINIGCISGLCWVNKVMKQDCGIGIKDLIVVSIVNFLFKEDHEKEITNNKS